MSTLKILSFRPDKKMPSPAVDVLPPHVCKFGLYCSRWNLKKTRLRIIGTSRLASNNLLRFSPCSWTIALSSFMIWFTSITSDSIWRIRSSRSTSISRSNSTCLRVCSFWWRSSAARSSRACRSCELEASSYSQLWRGSTCFIFLATSWLVTSDGQWGDKWNFVQSQAQAHSS